MCLLPYGCVQEFGEKESSIAVTSECSPNTRVLWWSTCLFPAWYLLRKVSLTCTFVLSNNWSVAPKKTSSDIWWTAKFSYQTAFCFLLWKQETFTWNQEPFRAFFFLETLQLLNSFIPFSYQVDQASSRFCQFFGQPGSNYSSSRSGSTGEITELPYNSSLGLMSRAEAAWPNVRAQELKSRSHEFKSCFDL